MKQSALNTIALITAALVAAGYTAKSNEDAVFVGLQHAGESYPAVLQLQDNDLRVTLQLGKVGDYNPDQLALVAVNALATNVEILPYAFAILKPEAGTGESELAESPLVLINSIPTDDLSSDELIWAVEKLQSALIAASYATASAERAAA